MPSGDELSVSKEILTNLSMSWCCVSIRVEAKVVEETKLQSVYVWGNDTFATAGPSK